MKILVLGNGFDLDHNLPTSYMDFLNFCNCALDIDDPNSIYLEKLANTQHEYIETLKNNDSMKNNFLYYISNNCLLKYFNNQTHRLGVNWIDFEKEIKFIINQVKSIEIQLIDSNQYNYTTDKNHKIHQILSDLNLDGMDTNTWSKISLNALHETLSNSLNKFCIALEIYITFFINNTPIIGIAPDIIDFDATNVLTFNYSDTYERMYGGVHWRESIDHIHGLAKANSSKESNIILGITTENISKSNYVEFEKYFQRITKRTGSKYKSWLTNKIPEKQLYEVVFFGHSLDSSDSDIINDLICDKRSTITIYYYNQKSHKEIVTNLIEIIGKEKLIEYASGNNPKIVFKRQKRHQENNTAGVEVERDIRALYKLHTMPNKDIDELINKILQKIKDENKMYFYSQRKTIDIFEALKYAEVESIIKEDFVNICKLFDYETTKSGNRRIFLLR